MSVQAGDAVAMGSFVGIGFAESIAVELADADTAMLWFALCLTTISVSLFFQPTFHSGH